MWTETALGGIMRQKLSRQAPAKAVLKAAAMLLLGAVWTARLTASVVPDISYSARLPHCVPALVFESGPRASINAGCDVRLPDTVIDDVEVPVEFGMHAIAGAQGPFAQADMYFRNFQN